MKALNGSHNGDLPGSLILELVDEFLDSCRARGLARSTVEQVYGYALKQMFLPWCKSENIDRIAALDQRRLDAFTAHLLNTRTRRDQVLSRNSVHMYVRTTRQFLKWCDSIGEAETGKPQLPRLNRRVVDTLSREEIKRLEDAARNDRDRLIVRLLADTGIRVGELRALRVDDLRTQDRRPLLKVSGKAGKERLVPIAPGLARQLQRHSASHRRHSATDRLFLSTRRDARGEYPPLTNSGVLQLLKGLAYTAGITKRVHPHLFRHSFATEALRRGMNPIQLAQILGHSGLRMIDSVYSHLNANDAYDALIKAFAD